MRLNIIGIKRIKGDKSKAGNPYDICALFGLVPIETSASDKMIVTGKGFEIAEVPFDPEQFDHVAFSSLKFPQVVDINMDSRPRFGKFESIAIGYELAKTV